MKPWKNLKINPNETWVFITPSSQWFLGYMDVNDQLLEWHCADINCTTPTQGQCGSMREAIETAHKAWEALHNGGYIYDMPSIDKTYALDFDINLTVKPGLHS